MNQNFEEKKVQIDQLVTKYMKLFKIPGFSVSIFQDGDIEQLSYGYSKILKRDKVTPESCFELGSISKSYTAAAIFLCEEKGLLNIDDYVTKYIPWLKIMDTQNENNIAPTMKISNFLYQTTGFHVSTLQLLKEGKSDDSLKKTVEELNGVTTIFHPGEQFNYATINYDVLGYIIECVSGKSYEDFLEKELLQPLGLYNTYLRREDVPVKTQGYKMGVFFPITYNAPTFRGNTPAGYIISNAMDMGKWMEIQLNGVDLPAPFNKVIEKCHKSNCTVPPFFRYYYAGGWYVSVTKTRMFHVGNTPNYSSMLVLNKKKNIGVCVLANIDAPVTEYLGNAIIKILEEMEVKEYTLSPNEEVHKWFQYIAIFGVLLWPFLLWSKTIVTFALIPFCIAFLCVLGLGLKHYYKYTVKIGLEKVNFRTIRLWSPFSYLTGIFVGIITVLGIVGKYLAFVIF